MGWLKNIGKKIKKTVQGAGKFVSKNLGIVSTAASLLPGGGLIAKGINAIDVNRMPKGAQAAAQRVNENMAQGKGGYNSAAVNTARNEKAKSDAKKKGGGGGLLAAGVVAALTIM